MNVKNVFTSTVISVIMIAVSLLAQPTSESYTYPVIPGTKEWSSLISHEQKRQVCQIEGSVLNTMSTSNLLETCLAYPLYADILAYDRIQEGFDCVVAGFNGLQELLKRKDIGVIAAEKYRKMDPDAVESTWSSLKKGEFSMQFFLIEILLAQDMVIANLPKFDRRQLLSDAIKKIISKGKHSDTFGLIGYNNNTLLIGRIMLKDNYAPFVKSVSQNMRLNKILQNAILCDKKDMSEIIKHAEQYLEQN